MKLKSNSNEENYLHYLRLFQMQLLGVLEDMEKPAESLSNVFSDVLIAVIDLKNDVAAGENFSNAATLNSLDEIIIQMQECITGFQFFDAKRQRLENISDGMTDLNEFITSKNSNNSADNILLAEKIVGLYKMEREHYIYREFLKENDELDELDSVVNK